MPKIYSYVGSPHLAKGDGELPSRMRVEQPQDVPRWISQTRQQTQADGTFVATFVVDADGGLWIADRHSEHVQCARRGCVVGG